MKLGLAKNAICFVENLITILMYWLGNEGVSQIFASHLIVFRKSWKYVLGILLSLNLVACGQRGPLYLPSEPPETHHEIHKNAGLGQ